MTVGAANIINEPLVEREKILLPPLHIKLGLMKQFVKVMDSDGDCFKYISKSFHRLSFKKLNAGIFDGPQIRKLINDSDFTKCMNDVEASAWCSYVLVIKNFLGSKKADNYEELVQNMLANFKNLGINMSIKLHFLHSHLDSYIILVIWVKNKGRGSIRIWRWLRKDTKADGTDTWWQITAGVYNVIVLMTRIKEFVQTAFF